MQIWLKKIFLSIINCVICDGKKRFIVIARRNIIIAVSAIVVFASAVGFFIIHDISVHIAYARLFIDAGLVIGLIAVILAFYKEKELPTNTVVNAINSLRNGNYDNKLKLETLGQISDIGEAVNLLAVYLSKHQQKQEEIKRNLREELLPGVKTINNLNHVVTPEHSHHPELGPVKTITHSDENDSENISGEWAKASLPEHEHIDAPKGLSNTLVHSNPPVLKLDPVDDDKELMLSQDIGKLYENFVNAQISNNIPQIDYGLFIKTIEDTKTSLMGHHNCKDIYFDIISDEKDVALQPKIIS